MGSTDSTDKNKKQTRVVHLVYKTGLPKQTKTKRQVWAQAVLTPVQPNCISLCHPYHPSTSTQYIRKAPKSARLQGWRSLLGTADNPIESFIIHCVWCQNFSSAILQQRKTNSEPMIRRLEFQSFCDIPVALVRVSYHVNCRLGRQSSTVVNQSSITEVYSQHSRASTTYEREKSATSETPSLCWLFEA